MTDDGATRFFERQILFGLGRHLWNILGVVGVVASLAGVILFVEGKFGKTQTYREWLDKNHPSLLAKNDVESLVKHYEVRIKQECERGAEAGPDCFPSNSNLRYDLQQYHYPKYETYATDDYALRSVRLATGPFIVAWGLGVVATVSVISAVLSIERNTRRD